MSTTNTRRGPRRTAMNDRPPLLGFAERIIEEVVALAAQLGVSDKELCRRAGYDADYLARRKTELRRWKEGEREPGTLTLVSWRFLADVEEAWGAKFDITAIPPRLRRGR